MDVLCWSGMYLVLLSASLFIVVKDVLPNIFPALMLCWNMVHSALPELVPTALLVPHSHCHQNS